MSQSIKNIDLTNKSSNLLNWKTMKLLDRPSNYGWAEEAYDSNNNVLFELYYDNDKSITILYDKTEDIKYSLPNGQKSKGYVLAFKLNNLRLSKIKHI